MTAEFGIARRRLLVDRAVAVLINAVGLGIVALLLLILWYLLSAALPLAGSFTIADPTVVEAGVVERAPAPVSLDGDGRWTFSAMEGSVRWRVAADGSYACATASASEARASESEATPARSLPAAVERPLSAVTLGEQSATLLVVDRGGALYRFALRPGAECGLQQLGAGQPQPFVADTLLAPSLRPLAILVSERGRLRVLLSTTGEVLFDGHLALPGPSDFALDQDERALLTRSGGTTLRWAFSAPFAEATKRSLWAPVWYSGYDAPSHVWHPGGEGTAAPRFGLTPLLWGTFKAALYGMLVAVPIALGAAIYTGFFLPPRMRNRVKPAIELIEAFPSVVLGFIAGIWLAPLLADYLVAVFVLPLLLLALPLLFALLHRAAQQLSPRFRRRPPRVAVLVVTYAATVLLLFWLLPLLAPALFGDGARDALLDRAGIHYEQRNALLVGLIMGFALVPTLFSIIEDAIFAVPRSLSDASLALGATRWQSLARVVLPAASPALLSALLIGLARGLGETMIVLLATGNTPIIEASLFSGLNSLAASLASELPEASVGGMQYRVLFLASLVLFGLTFTLNTIAELFRQRLRYRYAGR